MATPNKRPTIQQVTLIGIIILAFAAVLIAWMDKSGLLKVLLESLNQRPY